MDKRFHIGEISHFFNLPASTLRYWEDAGILSPGKNTENNYREYTVSDLMTISDLIFYRSLGISLKQIQIMESSTPDEHSLLFQQKIDELTNELQQIQSRIEKLRARQSAIQTIEQLKQHPFTKTDIDTESIVSFDLIEIEKLRQYIDNPYLYSRVQHTTDILSENRGLTIPADQLSLFPESEILWRKNSHTYIACLMKEEVTKGYPNNLDRLLTHIRKMHRTGYIISRFLLCAQEDGKLYDFYKTFVEIIP